MKETMKFWKVMAIALLVMCLIELGALYHSVTKLEGYYELTTQLRNEITALKRQTNSLYVPSTK